MNIRNLFTLLALWPTLNLCAQGLSYSSEEKQVFDEHKAVMTEPVEFLTADALSAIQTDYSVNPSDVKTLRNLCRRMETHKYLHNYILETAAGRLSIKREIETLYWDSIASILIPNNPAMAGTFTGHVVKMSDELNLSGDTLNAIRNLSVEYARRLRKDRCAFFAREEMDTLKTMLSRKQIEKVINVIHLKEIEQRCETLWQDLSSVGLTEELDKAADLRQAFNFFQKEAQIRDYFIGERELIDTNLNDLYRHKPRCIRMYEGIRLKEAVKKKHKERVGAEFSW